MVYIMHSARWYGMYFELISPFTKSNSQFEPFNIITNSSCENVHIDQILYFLQSVYYFLRKLGCYG